MAGSTSPAIDQIYAAFISYSQKADGELAAALESALERFPRLWYQPRPRRVFLDQGDITPAMSLSEELKRSLARSRRLVLLASPDAAASQYVDLELRWWLDHRTVDDVVLVLTTGDITTALPKTVAERLTSEPLYVDIRGLRASRPDPADAKWQEKLAAIVSALDDVPKDSLIGEHLRNTRRRRLLFSSLVAVLSILALIAGLAAWFAVDQRDRAVEQARLATARQLASLSDSMLPIRVDRARLLAVESFRMQPMPATRAALLQAVAASPQLVRFVPSDAAVTSLRTSIDGQKLVVGDASGRVRVLDVDGTALFTTSATAPVTAATASPGAVVVASRTTLAVWSLQQPGEPVGQVELPGAILDVAVDGASGAIVVVTPRPDDAYGSLAIGRLFLLDPTTLAVRATADVDVGSADFIPSENPRLHLAVGADHRVNVAAGACRRATLSIADLTTLETVADDICTPANRFVEAASPAATAGASMSVGGDAEVFDDDSGEPTRFANVPLDEPDMLAISADAARVAATQDDVIYVAPTSPENTDETPAVRLEGVNGTSAIEFLAGSRLASAGDGGVAIWDTAAYGLLARPTGTHTPDAHGFINAPDVRLSPDSSRAAVADETGAVRIVDTTARTAPIELRASTLPVPLTTAWSADSRSFAVVGGDGSGQVWTLADGVSRQQERWSAIHELTSDQVDSAVWAADGKLVIAGLNGTAVRFTPSEGSAREIVPAGEGESRGFRPLLSPDGRWLVRGRGETLEVVDLDAGQSRDLGASRSAAFVSFTDPEHATIVRRDGTTEVRALATGDLVSARPSSGPIPSAVAGDIAVAVAADGQLTITHSPSGQLLGQITLPAVTGDGLGTTAGTATAVTLTANAEVVITATSGGEILLWTLDPDDAVAIACATSERDLTGQDWTHLVGTAPPPDLRCRR